MENQKQTLPIPPTPQLEGADKKAVAKPPVNKQEEARKWSQRYDIAKTYQTPMFQKWGKWYDDMYAHVNNPITAPWRSKVYMPIIASKVWDLISRFIQYRPGWEVSVRTLPVNTLSKEQFDLYMDVMNQRVEKIRMKLDYDYDNPLMEEPIQDEMLGVMLDAAVTGQGVGRVPYCQKTSEYNEFVNEGDSVNFGQKKTTTATEGYNDFKAVNIFNFFIMPGAKGLQKSPWIIIKDQVPLYTLQKDPKYDKEALKAIKVGAITNEFAQYEASRNRLVNANDPVSLDTTTQMVEIYECEDKSTNEQVTYALGNGEIGTNWVEIYRGNNIYWHKKYPLVPFYIRRKPYQFWGESLFENSETLQSAVNDIFNHFMDNWNMGDGMIAIEEGSVVEPYIIEPGGEIRYRGEQPKQFKFPQPDAAGMAQAMNLVNGSIENATISQYASGIPNSNTDSTQGTATGVTRLMEAAAEKVGFMRSNFRRSWREVGQMWQSNTQQFMRTDVVYERKANGASKYDIIRPIDMIGIFGIKVDDGSFEPVSKDEQRKNFLEYVANLQSWQESSVAQAERTGDYTDALRVDWNEVSQRGSEKYGENSSHFLLPAVVPPTQAAPGETSPVTAPPVPTPVDNNYPPLPAEQALGLDTPLGQQSDGKSMPNTFPVRSVQSPGAGV
jgi:hypothetical protein